MFSLYYDLTSIVKWICTHIIYLFYIGSTYLNGIYIICISRKLLSMLLLYLKFETKYLIP